MSRHPWWFVVKTPIDGSLRDPETAEDRPFRSPEIFL
ncbi:hypothetical protein NIES22_71160 (plasmid) [Calothrix brevissima NIES-22]|nr:hypothetical protein NIES22_71160 [Calothrix brevissima NIES-22]